METTERPIVRCLVARWFAFHWQTQCVPSDEVPRYIADGWLNYMRDPFDLDTEREWEAAQAWEQYKAQQQDRR